jgi:hypothetical protein
LRFKNCFFTAIIFVTFLSVLAGCSNSDSVNLSEWKTQKITVQKRVGEDKNYLDFNEVTDKKKVQGAIEIVKNADWTDVKVEMSRNFDYQFQFPYKNNGASEDKTQSYLLWVNPDDRIVEIVTDSNKYVKLNKLKSEILYEILIGDCYPSRNALFNETMGWKYKLAVGSGNK